MNILEDLFMTEDGRILLLLIFAAFSVIHSFIWTCADDIYAESGIAPRPKGYWGLRQMGAAFIYWLSAFATGLLVIFCVDHIGICMNATFPDGADNETTILPVLIIAAAVLAEIVLVKLSRWLLGLVRGHNTLVDNWCVYKKMISEIMKDDNESIPQNERDVNMLGAFVTDCRKKRGLSKAKLAKLSGHPVSTIHGIENGDNQNPRFEIIIDLCKALDVSLEDMKNAFSENLMEKKLKS